MLESATERDGNMWHFEDQNRPIMLYTGARDAAKKKTARLAHLV